MVGLFVVSREHAAASAAVWDEAVLLPPHPPSGSKEEVEAAQSQSKVLSSLLIDPVLRSLKCQHTYRTGVGVKPRETHSVTTVFVLKTLLYV